MEGLPTTTDFSPFLGRTITMLRIGKYFVHCVLNDDKPNKPDAWIEIESNKITFTDSNGRSSEIKDFRADGGLLCLLLGLTIKNASRKNDGGLVFDMSEGIRLEVGVHTSKYESIVLHIGDKSIVG